MGSPVHIVVPVYDEGDSVLGLYDDLISEKVTFDDLRFVYDKDDDTTLPFIRELADRDPRVLAVRNTRGPGVINALSHAFAECDEGAVVVLMGDRSDALSVVAPAVEAQREGAVVVCPSRYTKGGEQHGGGYVKKHISRLAGMSLKLLGFPTSDPTNNFKVYDAAWLKRQTIESRGGFEIALELTYKAYAQGLRVVELPTVWRDRTQGQSRFRLFHWMPHYLRWYLKALRAIAARRLRGRAVLPIPDPESGTDSP